LEIILVSRAIEDIYLKIKCLKLLGILFFNMNYYECAKVFLDQATDMMEFYILEGKEDQDLKNLVYELA